MTPGYHNITKKTEFEHDFGDVIYRYKASNKIFDYCRNHKITPDILEYIVMNNITDSIITKFPNFIFITLDSKNQYDDSIKVSHIIKYINENINGVFLKFYQKDGIIRLPLIQINVIKDRLLNKEKQMALTLENSEDFYPFRIFASAIVKYKDDSLLNDSFIKENALGVLANTLGLDSFGKDTLVQRDCKGNIVLKQKYLDVLNLLYNPVIHNCLKMSEFKDALDSLKNLQK